MTASNTFNESDEAVLKTFVIDYMCDNGIGVQMIEAIARDLFGQFVTEGGTISGTAVQTPKEMLAGAVSDIISIPLFSDPTFDLQTVIDGAASLEFLVRFAHKLDPAIMPPNVIPSDELVAAALLQFHTNKKPALASS